MNNFIVCLVFLLCITTANLLATHYGMWITLLSSFFLIGIEMTCRDFLNTRIKKHQMILVVFVAGLLSYTINMSSINIALASSIAITVSCLLDYYVFNNVKGSWFKRSNVSNIISATVDSFIFTLIAFGGFYSLLLIGHISLKLLGGLCFTVLVLKFIK